MYLGILVLVLRHSISASTHLKLVRFRAFVGDNLGTSASPSVCVFRSSYLTFTLKDRYRANLQTSNSAPTNATRVMPT